VRRQLDGVEAWNVRRRQQEQAALVGQRSREQRLDLSRRMEVLREQHRAIVARTQEHLRRSADALSVQRPRAVVVHRNAWFSDKVAAAFASGGLDVVARLTNGAEAVGVVVAEQPDLLLVEDALPMLPGDVVVREVREYAPGTLIGAQVASDGGVATMLEAGATAAYVRRVPPAEVAAGLVGLLQRASR
jgi:CheY-like chemotaxis protein